MKTPITPQLIHQGLIEKVAASMRLDISGMNVEELQAGIIAELDNMEVRNAEALDHQKLVRAFDLTYANVQQSPVFYTNPKDDDFGHPLTGMQGTQFDTTGLVEQLIKEVLSEVLKKKVISERKKHLNMNQFKVLPPNTRTKLKWLALNGEEIGRGSGRIVYLIDSSKVLKFAMNQAGIAQNKAEWEAYTNPKVKPIVAMIYDHNHDFKWIVSELVRPMKSDEEFESFSNLDFSSFRNHIRNIKNKTIAQETLEKYPILQNVSSLLKYEKTMIEDIINIDHWGKTSNGTIVLLDYGYNLDVAKKYYDLDISTEEEGFDTTTSMRT